MNIVTRSQWGSNQLDLPGHPKPLTVSKAIFHHFFIPHIPPTATYEEERSTMRSVQRYHVLDNGWDDIGYGFVIFQSGRIYEGRGWWRTGAHTHGQNSKSIGICFAINGDLFTPTPRAWQSARNLLRKGVEIEALTPIVGIFGHTDFAIKSCPGRLTYPLLPDHLILSASSPTPDEDDAMFCKFGDRNEKVRALQVLLGYVHGERPDERSDGVGEFGSSTATMLAAALGMDGQMMKYGPWQYAGLQKVLMKKFARQVD